VRHRSQVESGNATLHTLGNFFPSRFIFFTAETRSSSKSAATASRAGLLGGTSIARQDHVLSASLNRKPQVMVVDDDLSMCAFLDSFLSERGYSALTLDKPEEALKRYQAERPAAVILDLVMPGTMDGLEALAAFKKIDPDVPIIVLSGQGRTTTVVQAMKLGAADFVGKPFDEPDLEGPLANALRHQQLSREAATRRAQLQSQSNDTMIFGHSERMAAVQHLIERVADTDATVLIRGEKGTGKELVARALCGASPRRDKPFIKVNCSALPGELLEPELFGFDHGALTGAIQHRPGKFEFANHGTMFLDEIGDVSMPLQAKLLQVLQDGEFSRLGARHDVKVDVRVVAATNRDLEQAVAEGRFREDLFLRLNVVCINMPPLRERREELPTLCDFLMTKYSMLYNKPYVELSPDTMRLFMEYDWPGNIRELENLIMRTVVLGTEAPIRKNMTDGRLTPTEIVAAATEAGNYSLKDISRTAAREAERDLILKMLQQTHWNRKETAEILNISYKALLYKIKENGLDKAS
jgi:two-component system response regulator AtoC